MENRIIEKFGPHLSGARVHSVANNRTLIHRRGRRQALLHPRRRRRRRRILPLAEQSSEVGSLNAWRRLQLRQVREVHGVLQELGGGEGLRRLEDGGAGVGEIRGWD